MKPFDDPPVLGSPRAQARTGLPMPVPPSSDALGPRIDAWRRQVREQLDAEIDAAAIPAPLRDAIRYGSTTAPASRWRAVLVLETGSIVGADPEACLLAACAVEALHCATLSVDDLPCMDDAEKRRGRPALHRRFNEALAIQAALWLLGISRSLLARAAAKAGSAPHSVDPVGAAARLATLQQQTEDALHLGQFLDLAGSLGRAEVDPEEVARLKCGRLFALAAEVPAWLPCREAAPSGLALALEAFGEAVGIAYQIRDDLDDDAEDERAATWSDDEASGRPTLVAAAGRGAAAARIEAHLARAGAALAPLAAAGVDPQLLMVLARRLLGEPVEVASPASPG